MREHDFRRHHRFAVELITPEATSGVAYSYPLRCLAVWRACHEQNWDARLGQYCGNWVVIDMDAQNGRQP